MTQSSPWHFRSWLSRLSEEYLLLALVLGLVFLWFYRPVPLEELPALVDWHTMAALTGLMILSRGLEDSGYLGYAGRFLLARMHNTRTLALFLVVFSAVLAAIVTNDIALFIVVPLTVGLARSADLPVGRLIIFEALAVNAGSTFSPIGNPQNLFLWQSAQVTFTEFLMAMWPLGLTLMLLLLALTVPAFSARPLVLADQSANTRLRKPLLWLSLIFYPVFLVLADMGYVGWAVLAVLVAYVLFFRRVLLGIDWLLLVVFLLMFIDLGLLAKLPAARGLAEHIDALPGGLFTASALLSQAISNVPATILLAEFSADWRTLAWGASVGGFGFMLGSLANLIALRLARQPGLWKEFHAWSLPLFAVSLLLGGWLNTLLQ